MLSSLLFLASSGVTLTLNDQVELSWQEPVRLSQALTESVQHVEGHDVYWPGVRLVNSTDNSAEALKTQALEDLDLLHSYWQQRGKENKARVVLALRAQIQSLEVATQPYSDIDIASSRQFIGSNPLLKDADYRLVLPPRTEQLLVLGAVAEAGAYQLQGGATASQYLAKLLATDGLLKGYDRNSATLVRGQQVHQIDWAYYNREGFEAMPGDILWLPLRGLPRRFSGLNQDIAELLTQFVGFTEETPVHSPQLVTEQQVADANHWSRRDYKPTRSQSGGVGLMQNPTARMMDEGEISLTYADMDEYRRYAVSLQVLPWLEANAFYVQFPNRLYSQVPGFSGDTILTDKGFDVKFRLWQESYWLPEFSVGLRDFAGTGIFDSEYLVANKRFGAFDFSLGVGFGRLGTRDSISNPFCELSDDYCSRPRGMSGRGGQFEYDQWFKGQASLFGGVEWQTPWQPLRVKLEYEGNDYSADRAGVPIEPRTPWNVGVNYRVTDWFDLQASYERGDTLMFNFTLSTNFNGIEPIRVEPRKVQPAAPYAESLDDVNWSQMSRDLRSNYALANARFAMDGEDTVRVFSSPRRYRDYDENVERAARILADQLPETVTTYDIVDTEFFAPSISTRVDAEAFKARINFEDEQGPEQTAELFERSKADAYPENEEDWLFNPDYRFRTRFGAKPFFNQDFGSPEDFHIYQLGITGFARRWFTPNLEVFGELGFNIANNYHKFNYVSDTQDDLPPVRTNVRNYVENDVWLDSLQATYFSQITNDLYGMAYGGYIERMFGGAGYEMVYRPLDKSWAIGFDINRVRQRNFTGGTGFHDYETTTGFVSLYYQMPWLEDTMLQLDFGRFLAGDDGVNMTFQKRFDSGVTAGAFAALTNVSSEEYGEGSFTKGFFISIPFDLMSVRPTRQRVGMTWIPLARNGGRQLHRRVRLYDALDDRSPFYNR
ncbi:YjbH domain-containing protein [Aliidiomarina minuta]|nr:YjbH domain-containing protein [Aliidiomarina minuta]